MYLFIGFYSFRDGGYCCFIYVVNEEGGGEVFSYVGFRLVVVVGFFSGLFGCVCFV